MFSRFTASARRVMQRAFREAKRWQHDFVGTEHLLYGLLCDADGPTVALNARPELMLEKVELSLQRHDAGMAMEQFPLSPASRRAFLAAADEAGQFRHQMIGPEHLLLGLLRESDCEAAQMLAAHGVNWEAARKAVAQIPADTYREAQIQANEVPRFALGDNPSADELERWVAPPITLDDETAQAHAGLHQDIANPLHELEAQVRLTQLLLGCVMGYAFGHWLAGWMMGSVMAMAGIGVASFRNSWVGGFVGVACGLFITPLFYPDLTTPLRPVFMGLLGGFLGSFLGDAWRFSRANAVRQPSPEPRDSEQEPTQERKQNINIS
jgi:Clp amino terminal domain, pathogenicity island component